MIVEKDKKMGGLPSVLRGHTKWVADHEASTVGDGVGSVSYTHLTLPTNDQV